MMSMPARSARTPGKPVEFGYKAQIVDNADGVILDHNVEVGNPADAPQLVPAIERITARTGHLQGGHRRPRLRPGWVKTTSTNSVYAAWRSHAS